MMSTLGVLLIIGLVFLMHRGGGGCCGHGHGHGGTGHGGHSSKTAMQILEERYARGEIDEATFQRMRAELGEK